MTERISTGDVPDIYIGTYGYQPVKYAQEKLILDLKKLPGSTELFNRIAPQYISEYLGGRYYVPWYAMTQLMIYNKVLLKEAGLDPEKPPQTDLSSNMNLPPKAQ